MKEFDSIREGMGAVKKPEAEEVTDMSTWEDEKLLARLAELNAELATPSSDISETEGFVEERDYCEQILLSRQSAVNE